MRSVSAFARLSALGNYLRPSRHFQAAALPTTLQQQLPLRIPSTYHRQSLISKYQLSTMVTTTIPTTQQGILVSKLGGPEVLEYRTDLPVPTPKEGQVLIKNHLSGLNYIDTYFRTGLYKSSKPEVLGREGVGTIVAVGPGPNPKNFAVGERVAWMGTAAYAEYSIALTEAHIARVPAGLSDEHVLAALLSGLTTLTFTKEAYPVKKGDWILIHAAAGGAGFLMTQLVKLAGARVIGTAGGLEKVELVKSLGADVVIDYRSAEGANWVEKVKEVTGGEGVDAVFDSVGKDTWEGSLQVVKRKGTVVYFGNASGPVPPLQIQLLASKNIKILRPTVFPYIQTQSEFDHYTEELFGLLKSGQLKVRIHKIYPLEEVAQAHIDIESRKTTGKLLLRP
ncbi:uncharacterized protein PADG_05523 [Paracoccidioides brasiliensis Pb18]|uniref:Probable quinone oxidoreductase n=1 Tax=Paracoccidioides brasiliensis (strain Pb18) TaxID=502780 RepID=C1GE37_PARBD|nr:uncharacterized protein PADG_05523 [Paracoccidioides brasiliensis Pb18]EEH49444.1 hypothetical protein PADG_05523 [Paracoccidioides brasiliensis Pb18]